MALLDSDIKADPVLGEDTWDLFETIESSFGVELGNYHELCGKSIRELADQIEERAGYGSPDKCLTAISFYRLRRTLMQFGIARKAIRPSTPLHKLVSWRTRRRRWRLMRENLGLELPALVFPRWALVLALSAPAAVLVSIRAFCGVHISVASIVVWSVLLVIPAFIVSVPLTRTLPPGSQTCGGLSELILAKNYAAFAVRSSGSAKADVLWALRQLVAIEMVMPIEEISPETRVPQDLNIY
jgi:hypothetical protein